MTDLVSGTLRFCAVLLSGALLLGCGGRDNPPAEPVQQQQPPPPAYGQQPPPAQQPVQQQPVQPQQQPAPAAQQPPPAGTAPGTAPATSEPAAIAFPCQSDATCVSHKCNTQVGKCVWPCQTNNDCQAGFQCVPPGCVPVMQ
jgi:hypothetical protein